MTEMWEEISIGEPEVFTYNLKIKNFVTIMTAKGKVRFYFVLWTTIFTKTSCNRLYYDVATKACAINMVNYIWVGFLRTVVLLLLF